MKTLRNPITKLVFLMLLLAVVSSQRHQAAAQERVAPEAGAGLAVHSGNGAP